MYKDSLYQKGYIEGYWDGVKDTVSGKVPNWKKTEIAGLPIKSMELSTRACNCLIHSGCTHVCDVIALSGDAILRMRNLGPKTASEIARWLIERDIFDTAWSEYI